MSAIIKVPTENVPAFNYQQGTVGTGATANVAMNFPAGSRFFIVVDTAVTIVLLRGAVEVFRFRRNNSDPIEINISRQFVSAVSPVGTGIDTVRLIAPAGPGVAYSIWRAQAHIEVF